MTCPENRQPDIADICERVRRKRKDYMSYDFSRIKNDILKTFFDLAQEYDTLKDLCRISVAVPYEFLKIESRLYLLDDHSGNLELVCDSLNGFQRKKQKAPAYVHLSNEPYRAGGSYVVPIKRKDFKAGEFAARQLAKPVLGMFEVFPNRKLTDDDRFFFTKYTNRVGYNIYNRMLDRQNIRHLKFINNLVLDIEHNVIIPNMFFKYLFRQQQKRINEMDELKADVEEVRESKIGPTRESCQAFIERIDGLHQGLAKNQEEIQKHHAQLSLFLESLFRRDHFVQGHLVLRQRPCFICKEIIRPQLEHFSIRFKARGIEIGHPRDMQNDDIPPLMVDVGLLSQVYANLFSNAVKYTEEIIDPGQGPRKVVAYGREVLRNYFGNKKDGIKFNVFSTGKHLSVEEAKSVFASGYRRERDKDHPGTGHGLSFIKHVIEIHSGQVGYEPTGQGNNFYFILPIPPEGPADDSELD